MESPLFHGPSALAIAEARAHGVQLIETLGWDGAHLPRLDLHLARLARGAAALGYPCDTRRARAALLAAGIGAPARLRLTLDAQGHVNVTSAPIPAAKPVWRVGLAPQKLHSDDPYLRIKSTHRPAYDAARAGMAQGLDEVILVNQRGEVADGSITTVFFDRGQGMRTPPLQSGALPGVLRAALNYPEESLFANEIDSVSLWVGNSLRGIIKAHFVIQP